MSQCEENKTEYNIRVWSREDRKEKRRNLRKGRAERLGMGVKGVDAESTGRDNDPGGLGDLPDSQGPNMAQSQERDSVSGPPHVTIRRLSHGTPLGREINNVLREH